MTATTFRTKRESYAAYHAGHFGNKLRTWEAKAELDASGYRGEVTIRSVGRAAGKCAYYVPYADIERTLADWPREVRTAFNEAAPDHALVIQGELTRNEYGLYLYYSTAKLPMRKALSESGRSARRLEAQGLLEQHLTPSSYDDLTALLDLYPDDVIEFTAFRHCVGCWPHRNAVVWEVRSY